MLETLSNESRRFQKYWQRFHQLLAERPAKSAESVIASPRYSFTQDTFDLLIKRREVSNRADQVIVEVDFFPLYQVLPKEDPRPPIYDKPGEFGFAKHYMRVTYLGLSTEASDGLVIDAVGNPDGPVVKDYARRAKLHLRLVTPLPGSGAINESGSGDEFKAYDSLLKKSEDKFVKSGSLRFFNTGSAYANVICYELRDADPISTPEITLLYFANHACRLGKKAADAVGFALPADLLIRSVKVRVTFHEGLRPLDPSSRPFLIRRFAKAARPDQFASADVPPPSPATPTDSNTRTFTFELARPKPGYGYVISWTGLVWEPTGSIHPKHNWTEAAGDYHDWSDAQLT
jgi:hypothetical protein